MFRAIHSNGAYNASEGRQIVLDETVKARLHELGDLELAILICLIAQEHCMFSTENGLNAQLQDELMLLCSHTFGLQAVVVQCSPEMTVDKFSEAILVDCDDPGDADQHD